MPLNRYGGYGGYGGGSYSSYTSNFSSTYGRAGSASPATLRAATPSRGFGNNSLINTILPEDRTAYKISSYYSPGTYSRLYSAEYDRRDLKTIKTEELNTEDEREKERKHAIPGEITRDTTLNIRGGKPVVRMVTQKAKENPYINNPGWRSKIKDEEDKNNLTLGQRLALKHQIVEKPRVKEKSPSSGKSRTEVKKSDSGDEESEWTWETCSSSSQEQDGYDYTVISSKMNKRNKTKTPPPQDKRPALVYSRSNTTTLCSLEDNTSIKQQQQQPTTPTSANINSADRNRWLESLSSERTKQCSTDHRVSSGHTETRTESTRNLTTSSSSSRPVSWAGTHPLTDVQGNIHTKDKHASSGSSSGSSPPLYKYQPNKTGFRRVELPESSDDEAVSSGVGWRPGQPPRGEVVVKLSSANKTVIDKEPSKTSDTIISSKVPGKMNERYQVPGLFIKPSTKEAPKSVEAKLTLSPVEGKISLTTKVKEEKGSYQSSIFTPSKSPVLESKPPAAAAPSVARTDVGVASVCLSSVVETGNKSGDESEWEYYTETEPSDEEEKHEQESETKTDKTKKQLIADETKANLLQTQKSNIPEVPFSHLQTPNQVKPVKVPPPKHSVDIVPIKEADKIIPEKINNNIKDVVKPEVKTVANNNKVENASKISSKSPSSNISQKGPEVKKEEPKIAISKAENKVEDLSKQKVTKENKQDVEIKGKVQNKDLHLNKVDKVDKKAAVSHVPATDSKVKSDPVKAVTEQNTDSLKKKSDKEVSEVANCDNRAASSKNELKKDQEYVSRTSSPENGMPATSLERLPSELKNMFVGNVSPRSSPENAPKWYNNNPKTDPDQERQNKMIAQMKNDFNKQVKNQSKEEESLIKVSNQPTNPWYNDDDDDMKELLLKRPSILKEVDMNQDRRLTPEENTAVINMYGGVMFPGGHLEKTPKNLLFKVRKSVTESGERDSGFESQITSPRTNSASSNSSTMSSFATFSESPSPSPAHSDDSDQYSDSDNEDNQKVFKNTINQAPTKTRPDFKKYAVKDFRFLKVLGKGSFGKVLLAELRNTQNFYAVKVLRKDTVLEDDDIECVMIERKVLALGVKHPFLCHLFCTLQTDSHLFFVMEFLNGGDLMFHIQQSGRFETERARFYSAEIVCALMFLHRKGIVYRDLKLDNLLLDYEGHIRLVDFGMCKLQIYLDKTSDTFCGTPDYMAPEIIKGMKYTHSVDWWSFGVLLYEMLIGQSPFNGCDEDELFWSICNEPAYFPRFLSKEAKQMLLLLLEKNPSKRLGVSDSIQGDIRSQAFYNSIDFYKLERKQIAPPYKPKLKNAMDVSYFDNAFTEEPIKLTPVDRNFLDHLNQTQFKGFSYTNKQYTS